MHERVQDAIMDMIEYGQAAQGLLERHDEMDLKHGDEKWALERVISIIGEAAARVPDFARADIDLPWKSIVGAKNIITHSYENVEPEFLLTMVKKDIPTMIATLESYLEFA